VLVWWVWRGGVALDAIKERISGVPACYSLRGAAILGMQLREKCPCKHEGRSEGKQNEGEIVSTKGETL